MNRCIFREDMRENSFHISARLTLILNYFDLSTNLPVTLRVGNRWSKFERCTMFRFRVND